MRGIHRHLECQGAAWGRGGGGQEKKTNTEESALWWVQGAHTSMAGLALQSCKFGVWLLLTAGTGSLPRAQPGHLSEPQGTA